MSNSRDFAAIILAAGEGKRMKSTLPKVLHPVDQKPLLKRTLEILDQIKPHQTIIVVNPNNISQIKKAVGNNYTFSVQPAPLGTGNAAEVGLEKVDKDTETVAVIYGDDSAFYKPKTIIQVLKKHQKSKSKITFVTLDIENPTGLGRVVRKKGKLIGIVEEKDSTNSQKKIKEVNVGLYFFEKEWLANNLPKIKPSKATSELYLTDLVKLALSQKVQIQTFKLEDPNEWHGVNTPQDLAAASQKLNQKHSSQVNSNLSAVRRIHIMGAAGAGASAIFSIAKSYGYQVSGCDLNPKSSYVQQSAVLKQGHDPAHLEDSDLLVISPAVEKLDPKNPELEYARRHKIPILTWQKFQGKYLQKNKFVIAVAGAYGKSTTTAMISQILIDVGLDPTCEIGANVLVWRTNYRIGASKYYVCEADEYNNNFLSYKPDIAVILNAAWDHPDFFKTKEQVASSYSKFINQIKPGGTLIINQETANQIKRSDIKVIRIKKFEDILLSIIGDFRKENADAALSLAEILKINLQLAKKSLESFQGIARRLEYRGDVGKSKVYDDYAVQPYTVLAAANALKEKFLNKKIVLVFEPHTFSRIEKFFDQFVKSLKNTQVDQILVTDVYAAREKGDKEALAQKLAKSVGLKAQYTGSLEDTARYLTDRLNEFDVILSMGAGDAYKLYDLLKS